jgi:hypothetical protein
MRYLSSVVPQGGTKDGWSLPACDLNPFFLSVNFQHRTLCIHVGDRVRVELIGTDVERGFIDFARAG